MECGTITGNAKLQAWMKEMRNRERPGISSNAVKSPDVLALSEKLAREPLSQEDRAIFWSALLGNYGCHVEGHKCPSTLLQLFCPEIDDDDAGYEVLFEADTHLQTDAPNRPNDGAEPSVQKLTVAFSQLFLAWLYPSEDAGVDDVYAGRYIFVLLTQLLRYHYPKMASSLANLCKAVGHDIPGALAAACSSCGIRMTLGEMIFDKIVDDSTVLYPEHRGRDALLLLCDLTLLEGEGELLLFVIVTLLADISLSDSSSFSQIEDAVRGSLTMASLRRYTQAQIRDCVTSAKELLQATPMSVKRGLSCESWGHRRFDLAMSAVSPEDVLYHTSSQISQVGTWRLIVVDARMRDSKWTLPTAFELPRVQHGQRRRVLRDEVPQDDAVHLCLIGDAAPASGDDGFELARFLATWRRHVSVVQGGWPAVEELAFSLGIDLVPCVDGFGSQDSGGIVGEQARAAVVEVAGQARSTATAMARSAWLGAGRALSSMVGGPAPQGSAPQGSAPQSSAPQSLAPQSSAQDGAACDSPLEDPEFIVFRSSDCIDDDL